MTRKLGPLEATALAYVQMRNMRMARTGDLAKPLRINAKQERELMSRMARSGLIANVRRGLYLFPPKLPLGDRWTPDEATALNALMSDKRARYQITGPNAFNRYGFDEQVPSRIYAYNDQISGDRTIGQVALTLIKVAGARLGDVEQVPTRSGETLVYSSRTRTLMDAVYDWPRFGGLPRAYDWIRGDIQTGRVMIGDLAQTTIRYGNQGTIRRISALLEELDVDEAILKSLKRSLASSKVRILFVPNRPSRGRLLKRWGVVLND